MTSRTLVCRSLPHTLLSGLSLLQSQEPGASRLISTVRLDFDTGASQIVDLDGRSLIGNGQPIELPADSTFVRITITGVVGGELSVFAPMTFIAPDTSC